MYFNEDDFKKSTACWMCEHCVEVAENHGVIAVRDSKDPGKNLLTFTKDEWQAFIIGVKQGEFDFQ